MSSTSATENRRLFTPLKLGRATVENRVALAPLTRFRAPDHVPVERHAQYYAQRAHGNLLITEGTFISEAAGGYLHVPGIWSKEQIEGWKRTNKAVHDKGGVIYCQLWAIGRANKGDQDVKKVVSSSSTPFEGGAIPEPLSKEGIKEYVQAYRQAALNAIEAGFDGVEIHSANGYLLQQFLHEKDSNSRTDEYGGSLENRTRFVKEVMAAVTEAIGEDRTGIRWSPWGTFQGMGTDPEQSLKETYVHLCEYVKTTYPKFSYVHFVEDSGAWMGKEILHPRSNDIFRAVFRSPAGEKDPVLGEGFPDPDAESPTVFISCGDYKTESSLAVSQLKGDLVAIGRSYISNPDLPRRIQENLEWTAYDRFTFYVPLSDAGYLDYANYGEHGHGEEAEKKRQQDKEKKANM